MNRAISFGIAAAKAMKGAVQWPNDAVDRDRTGLMSSTENLTEIWERNRPLQVGFIPDLDCAPLVIAHESGLFQKYEVRVELRRETRWTSIRDKIVNGELDAAHAPATLPFIIDLGIESDQCASVVALVMSLQGNAITVSRELWEKGIRDAAGLRDEIFQNWGRRTYTFGVVFPFSPPFFLLRNWLKQGGILPGIELRVVVVPPAQLFPMLKLGYIDGFCGGEPWTSLAVDSQSGRTLATSADIAPLHPEKVLMMRHDFARNRASEHERLIAALLEAAAFCDQPKNRPMISEILSRAEYVNAPVSCLEAGFSGPSGVKSVPHGRISGASVFHRLQANDPTDSKAAWITDCLYQLMDESKLPMRFMNRTPVIRNLFRRDIFQRARALMQSQTDKLSAEADAYSAQF